ncbi:hypothetical protein C7I85_10330 [Mesorhizobium soli]|uniref:Uncharacterized protein n=2 Tax=Pseudaminobacter soli (ex Li et al. 2025) TaxID=1295366 RepID=A0A2P7SG28_9HYPH|nr:hypothetical protein C7I85_10330 [Mesorhizobium soli]
MLLAALAVPAAAETRYDVKLEQAVMDIVAGKMGDIRGTISYRRKLESVILPVSFLHNQTVPETRRAEVEFSGGDLLPEGRRAAPRIVATF